MKWLSFVFIALAGLFSGVADIAETPAKFNQSVFRKWNPAFEYGDYFSHKDEGWVNKYAIKDDGTVNLEQPKFFGSTTFLVALTDLWHGARAVMLACFLLAVITYKQPHDWFINILHYIFLYLCYSGTWTVVNWVLL